MKYYLKTESGYYYKKKRKWNITIKQSKDILLKRVKYQPTRKMGWDMTQELYLKSKMGGKSSKGDCVLPQNGDVILPLNRDGKLPDTLKQSLDIDS